MTVALDQRMKNNKKMTSRVTQKEKIETIGKKQNDNSFSNIYILWFDSSRLNIMMMHVHTV